MQKVWKQLISQWNMACKENQLLKRVVHSKLGDVTEKAGKNVAYYLVRCLMNITQYSGAEKVGILSIPHDIQAWAAAHGEKRRTRAKTADGRNDEVDSDPILFASNSDALQEHIQRDLAIDQVLKYWFGQYNPEQSQKRLWMIASSSEEHRNKIDAEIFTKFNQLLVDLSERPNMRDAWCSGKHGWRGCIASIIVLDQMSRHIHRYFQTIGDVVTALTLEEQKTLDNISHDIAQDFQSTFAEELACGMIPLPMMIFALMPLRHKSTLQSVGFVKKQVESIGTIHSVDMENMVRRFRRATNRRMAVLQDEARRDGRETVYIQSDDPDGDAHSVEKRQSTNTSFDEEDILDFHHFKADTSNANKSSIVRTMVQFFAARGIRPSSGSNIVRNTPIIVSLSGGIDSMVIAAALAHLRDGCNFSQLYIVAVHIDYGNRPESAAEAAYVKYYALNKLHLDRCVVRVINEVTRGVTKRDEYEKLSRNIRYDLYRDTVVDCIKTCTENSPSCRIAEVGVMLGHHRGDVVENVISNSNKGSGPLDLSGMTSVSKNDGVTIYRPLLPLEKTDVYDYSHKYGVPYFKDTTPHWSTRGKLRNKLIPLLMEVYGDGCLSNLACLAEESDEARELFTETSLKPFMEKVERFPLGIIFDTTSFANQGIYFWKLALKDLLHSAGLGMFSEKSVQSFLKRILPKKITSGTYTITDIC